MNTGRSAANDASKVLSPGANSTKPPTNTSADANETETRLARLEGDVKALQVTVRTLEQRLRKAERTPKAG
ncbi:hypothetical protein [Actinokineospora enzanensis]|uniref:hypothetical protein n=1 Tax=Actinokineospora enzanensis TaxID=155975 RepID=UPI00035C5D22|nr:hypothetical protein [Actinokineospora enzanensis]